MPVRSHCSASPICRDENEFCAPTTAASEPPVLPLKQPTFYTHTAYIQTRLFLSLDAKDRSVKRSIHLPTPFIRDLHVGQ